MDVPASDEEVMALVYGSFWKTGGNWLRRMLIVTETVLLVSCGVPLSRANTLYCNDKLLKIQITHELLGTQHLIFILNWMQQLVFAFFYAKEKIL